MPRSPLPASQELIGWEQRLAACLAVLGVSAILNPDSRSLHGLAHPVRMQIFELLSFDGPVTAR